MSSDLLNLLSIVAPAFVVSLLVAATHVPLGIEVLRRGIIFIDLATAQIAALGAVAATVYLGDAHEFSEIVIVDLTAFGAAVAAGLFFSWVEKRLHDYQEALIGCSFVLAASMALLLLANQPMGGDDIKDLLAGQVLFVDWIQIGWVAAVYIPLLAVWFRFRERLGRVGFYIVFAVVVTTSVQIVGVYLVFAALIFPALGAWAWPERTRLKAAYLAAAIGTALGLIVSVATDYPTGPTLVWSLALVSLAGALLELRLKAA
jgi:zinc/manganese transport system permease protein